MHKLHEANFLYLLIGLMVVLLGGPIGSEFTGQPPGLIVRLTFSATLIIGVWSLIGSRNWFRVGIVLAIADLVVTAVIYFRPNDMLEILSFGIAFVFCALSLVFALRQIFFVGRVDLNSIVGAVCVYLLLGVQLTLLNILVYRLVPGSFNGLQGAGDPNHGGMLIYYSFVTMTTLGYGDITPAGPLARALAYLGAVAGQFYMAVLVGMAVGLFLTQRPPIK